MSLFIHPVSYTPFSSHLATCIQQFTWVLRNFIRGEKNPINILGISHIQSCSIGWGG